MRRPGWLRMAFIERALEDDPTNWWAPDHACVKAMLRAAGSCVATRPGHEISICTPNESEAPIPANLRTVELETIFAISGDPR